MTYISAAVIPAPAEGRSAYVEFAGRMAPVLRGFGVLRAVDAWPEDVPHGKRTDMHRAVASTESEAPVFSWMEFPDAATAESATKSMMTDPKMQEVGPEMPFDGARMIFGGFEPLVDAGAARPGEAGAFVDAALFPVKTEAKASYAERAAKLAEMFLAAGALRSFDGWGHHVPEGQVTDMLRAVALEPGETLALGFIEWPSKEVRDAAWGKLMNEPSLAPSADAATDMTRMIHGGFVSVVDA